MPRENLGDDLKALNAFGDMQRMAAIDLIKSMGAENDMVKAGQIIEAATILQAAQYLAGAGRLANQGRVREDWSDGIKFSALAELRRQEVNGVA